MNDLKKGDVCVIVRLDHYEELLGLELWDIVVLAEDDRDIAPFCETIVGTWAVCSKDLVKIGEL